MTSPYEAACLRKPFSVAVLPPMSVHVIEMNTSEAQLYLQSCGMVDGDQFFATDGYFRVLATLLGPAATLHWARVQEVIVSGG